MRDFKTGSVWEDEAGRVIKPAYRIQMQLYAALFFEQEGEWPKRLELASQNEIIEVDFEPSECLALLQIAKDSLGIWNSLVAAAQSSAAPETLATPGSHCGFCPFRPVCPTYWSAQLPHNGADVRGEVEAVQRLGNGDWQLDICSPEGLFHSVTLPNEPHHWASGQARTGQQAEIYGLQKRDDSQFKATALTLVYLG